MIPVFERGGYEVVDPGRFTPFTDDFSAIIAELKASHVSERQGRAIDHDASGSIEKKKQEGYF